MRIGITVGVALATLTSVGLSAPAQASGPHPILAQGMQHTSVKKVQRVLKVTPRSGFFGPATHAAVLKFQSKRAIPTTGVVGPLTWAALDRRIKTVKHNRHHQRPKPTRGNPKRKPGGEIPSVTLKYGDRGATVHDLQLELGVTPASGWFGPITQSYVKALQSAADLPATGIVDSATWRKVGKVRFSAPVLAAAAPTAATAAAAPTSATAAQILAIAGTQAGVPYVSSGNSPSTGFNCSSFTQWVFGQVGIDLGGAYTVWQYDHARHISAAEALPGDLVFFYNYQNNFIGHVGIYAGNGMMWHAPRTGRVVSLEPVYSDKVLYARALNQ